MSPVTLQIQNITTLRGIINYRLLTVHYRLPQVPTQGIMFTATTWTFTGQNFTLVYRFSVEDCEHCGFQMTDATWFYIGTDVNITLKLDGGEHWCGLYY